jgi:osmotically-inducible protein OsmY
MMTVRLKSIILVYTFFLAGCTEIIHVATENPIQPEPEKISIGTDIDDWELETSIGVNIKKNSPELESSNINVNSYNRVVLLTGQAPTAEARSRAAEVARQYRGVRQVYNEIKISGPTSLIARTNDAWLTAKVKHKLMRSDQIESSSVKVVTENGIIYLMGLISQEKAKEALRLTSEIGGAVKVVSVLEYTD